MDPVITEALRDILNTVLIVIVPTLVALANKYIRTWTENFTKQVKNNELKLMIEDIEKLVEQAVVETTNTYVSALKDTDQWTKEAQANALDLTKKKLLTLINENRKIIIEKIYGSFDAWLTSKIELLVNNTKEMAMQEMDLSNLIDAYKQHEVE
jgi:hypothetical protein